jgi:hypothetical protein
VPFDVPLRLRTISSWSRDVQVDNRSLSERIRAVVQLLDKVELKALRSLQSAYL